MLDNIVVNLKLKQFTSALADQITVNIQDQSQVVTVTVTNENVEDAETIAN